MNRFEKIRSCFDEYGIDAMLLTEEVNRYYATGFPSMGTDGIALVTKQGNYYFTDPRYTVAAQQGVTDAELYISMDRDYITPINEIIRREGIHAMGFDDAYMTVVDYERYKSSLDCPLVGASRLMTGLRLVKDKQEIEYLTQAQRISEKALEKVMEFIRPGVTEKEIAAELQYHMLRFGADKTSFDPIIVSGVNGAMPHGVPSDKKVERGEFVTMDFGCRFNGYCSDMTRTVAVGSVTPEMERVYHTVLSAQMAAIVATAAGKSGAEIDAVARKVINGAGYGKYFEHGYGHGVGIEIHEGPTVSFQNREPLPAGAVTSAEPGIYIPGAFGVRIEDVVIVRENGCEDITLAPKELIIIR